MEERTLFWIIDRFEGPIAVVETDVGETVNVPRNSLPAGIKEGAVLRIVVDKEEEARRKKKTRSLFDRLRVD